MSETEVFDKSTCPSTDPGASDNSAALELIGNYTVTNQWNCFIVGPFPIK